jgi:hypothetical protein
VFNRRLCHKMLLTLLRSCRCCTHDHCSSDSEGSIWFVVVARVLGNRLQVVLSIGLCCQGPDAPHTYCVPHQNQSACVCHLDCSKLAGCANLAEQLSFDVVTSRRLVCCPLHPAEVGGGRLVELLSPPATAGDASGAQTP